MWERKKDPCSHEQMLIGEAEDVLIIVILNKYLCPIEDGLLMNFRNPNWKQ
jgi:hypothetical protein